MFARNGRQNLSPVSIGLIYMKSSENNGPIYVFETALISGGKIKIREEVVAQVVTITIVTVEMKLKLLINNERILKK